MIIKKIPTIVIFTALVVSFLSNFIDLDFYLFSDIIGYSISFNIIIIYFLKKLKYCIHTILAMCNLTSLNIYSILNSYDIIDYNTYSSGYDSLSMILMFISIFIYSATKKK